MDLRVIRKALGGHKNRAASIHERVARVVDEIEKLERELASVEGDGEAPSRRGGGRRRRGRGRARAGRAAPVRASRRGKRVGAGRRPKGESLEAYITKVLQGSSKPMGIAEVVDGVKKAGYATSSPSFAKIVGMRLSGSKQFKRAGRGMYQLAK